MPHSPSDRDVVHEPDPSFVAESNVAAFAEAQGLGSPAALLERSTEDVEWFWDAVVDHLGVEFETPYDAVRDDSRGPQFTRWYPGGRLNVAHNTVDRHADDPATRGDTAVVWEGEPGDTEEWSFRDVHRESNRVANALREWGVEVGDTVGIYLPMLPEVVPTLYGCLKAGAVAVPVFSGFGAEAAATRLADADCTVLLTADGYYRRGEVVDLKPTADEAAERAGCVDHVVVRERVGTEVSWTDRDEWWADAVGGASDDFETVTLDASAEAMLLYSSGTTGEPKGIVHTHAGTLLQPAKEIYLNFDHRPDDRFFWLSDIGWMMGPWTLVGNHAFGGTVVLYEGAPDHPDPDRLWAMIDRHDVTTFGVSPTAVRSLRAAGEEWLEGHDRSSLRLLGSTGEPWDEDSWKWFYEAVGEGRCPILNISGGTEIFGCFVMPLPTQPLKPCTVGGPGLGMDVDIVDEDGDPVGAGEQGYLVARDSCPSMSKSLWSGDERYLAEYWSRWDDLWNHGDWASRDADGFWFLHGRADDALNVAGRKVGPAEVEEALLDHGAVSQAAAVGVPDETTGTAVVAYVVTTPGVEGDDGLRAALVQRVGDSVGKPFRPREVLFAEELPVTQSGKIVRRAVQAAYTGEDVGDRSSIANPEAIDALAE